MRTWCKVRNFASQKFRLTLDQIHYNQSWRWSWLHTTLAQITRIAPKWIYTVLKSFFTVHDFWATCACPEKNRVALKIFTVVDILFIFRIFNNLRLPWKQSFSWNFSLYWIYFYYSGFLSNCPRPEKQSCPEIFHCIEYTFCIQESWATCAFPEKQRVPWNFWLYWNIFYHSEFLSNLPLPWKTEFPWNFSLYSGFFKAF